ncbi:T9SS type A sorting domain-containing protein [Nibribacter koreensis]|uniref:Secretion system C-terminal sorting domain-containing protein n=1 Tax=Nibribacter koreensis TaxID=1084519 RepID=A0ABP8FAR3_9BACT
MKMNTTFTSVFLSMLAVGTLSGSQAFAQKKKKAPAKDKTSVRMYHGKNGKLVLVDTLVTVTPEELARYKHLAENARQNSQSIERILVRPSGMGTTSMDGIIQGRAMVDGEGSLRAQLLASEDSTKERTVKLKILKKEEGQYYMLDTTLVIPAGVSKMTAVRKLSPEGHSLRSLGAKPVQNSTIPGVQTFEKMRIHALASNDSTKAMTFRSISGDSAVQVVHGQIIKNGKQANKWVTTVEANGEPKKGHTFYLRRSMSGDSLLPGKVFIYTDSLVQLVRDTLMKNKSFSIVKDVAGQINVFQSINEGSAGAERRLSLALPKEKERFEIIVLRPTVKAEEPQKAKTSKSKEAKTNNDFKVSLYPNPTSGRFTVSFTIDKKSDTRLRVVDSTGRTVMEENAGMQKGLFTRDLDISKFGRGVYILQILCGKNVRSERVVVQ